MHESRMFNPTDPADAKYAFLFFATNAVYYFLGHKIYLGVAPSSWESVFIQGGGSWEPLPEDPGDLSRPLRGLSESDRKERIPKFMDFS